MSKTNEECSQELNRVNSPSSPKKLTENASQVEIFRKVMAESVKARSSSCGCRWIVVLYVFLMRIIRKLINKNVDSQRVGVLSSNVNQETRNSEYPNSKAIKFFRLLMLLRRCIKVMKFRTKFKGIEFIKKKDISIIGDLSFFEIHEQKRMLRFFLIRSKFLRRIVISLIKFAKIHLIRPANKLFSIHSIFLINGVIKKTLAWFDAHIPIILPGMKVKLIWDLIIIFVISLYFYLIPMQLFFDVFYDDEIENAFVFVKLNHYLGKFIIMIPEILLIFDTILKFFTGFYEDGIVVTQRAKIFSHYIHKGLLFDILSYLPVILQGIIRTNFPDQFEAHPLIIKEVQLLMFFKIKRVQTAMMNFEEIIASKGNRGIFLSFFRLIYVVLFVTHLNACLWHGIAYFNPDPKISTWLDSSGLHEEYWLIKYFYSYFWAISAVATMGYGERISPQNTFEIVAGSFIILCSLLLTCFCINSMKLIFDAIAKPENDYQEMIRIINSYMKKNDLGFELQSRVRRYLEYTMKNEDDEVGLHKILNKLTKSLKSEVLFESYGKYIDENEFFKRFTAKTKEKIILSISEIKFSPEEIIYQEGEFNDSCLYILFSGMVDEVVGADKVLRTHTLRTISVLDIPFSGLSKNGIRKKGEIFGWHPFFSNRKHETSFISRNFSSVLEIKKEDFLNIVSENKEDYVFFRSSFSFIILNSIASLLYDQRSNKNL